MLGGCSNCAKRPVFDLFVDVTPALRARQIHPRRAKLEVMVEFSDGTIVPLSGTAVPAPVLKGPNFAAEAAIAEGGENDTDDVSELQRQLRMFGIAEVGEVDGSAGPQTVAALRRFQREAGLSEDGVAGPKTKRLLTVVGLARDAPTEVDGVKEDRLAVKKGCTVKWHVDIDSAPSYLDDDAVVAELTTAFGTWGAALELTFERSDAPGDGVLLVEWNDLTDKAENPFDGPGGVLADATPAGIAFDSAERWELHGAQSWRRQLAASDSIASGSGAAFWANASIFKLLPVAIHEIGHVLGLGHSRDPKDMMSPFYLADQIALSDNDVGRARALVE
jgi:hypothetical protein